MISVGRWIPLSGQKCQQTAGYNGIHRFCYYQLKVYRQCQPVDGCSICRSGGDFIGGYQFNQIFSTGTTKTLQTTLKTTTSGGPTCATLSSDCPYGCIKSGPLNQCTG